MKISDITEALYFHGSRCTVDCGGHKAGYAYANAKPHKSCDSHSPSFTKGCIIGQQHMKADQEDVLPVGTTVTNALNNVNYVWRGAQWIDQNTGRVADYKTAQSLNKLIQSQKTA